MKKQRTTQSKTDTTLTYVAAVTGILGMLAYVVGSVVWAIHGGL